MAYLSIGSDLSTSRLPGFRLFETLAHRVAQWNERRRIRNQINRAYESAGSLFERDLRDIGISPEQIEFEASRGHWTA